MAEKIINQDKNPFQGEIAGVAGPEITNDVIPALTVRHPLFVFTSSLAFAALFTELLFFAASYYGSGLTNSTNQAALAGVFVLTLGGFWASFSLPHLIYKSRFDRYSPIIFLVREWTASIIIIVGVSLISFGVGIFLVNGNLGGVGEILRSLALYAMAGIVCFHGLVTFSRYVQYLYERELHQSYKIVTAAGLAIVILLVVTLYLLQYDLGRLGNPDPQKDLVSFHLSLRDIWLVAMNMFALFWTYSRLADH